MRFLSALCGLLLLANLVVLIWPDKNSNASHVYSARSDVNAHFVRLNKEIEEKFRSAPSVSNQQALVSPSDEGEASCYRLGPFMHKANYELAQAVLYNANVEYKKSTRKSKQSTVYRVYLGPFATQAEAVDTRTELRSKNILDHFIRRQGDGGYIISLGIYTSLNSAQAATELFSDRIERLNVGKENLLLPDSHWLLFALDIDQQTNQQLAQMDWGEQSAKLGRFNCSNA